MSNGNRSIAILWIRPGVILLTEKVKEFLDVFIIIFNWFFQSGVEQVFPCLDLFAEKIDNHMPESFLMGAGNFFFKA